MAAAAKPFCSTASAINLRVVTSRLWRGPHHGRPGLRPSVVRLRVATRHPAPHPRHGVIKITSRCGPGIRHDIGPYNIAHEHTRSHRFLSVDPGGEAVADVFQFVDHRIAELFAQFLVQLRSEFNITQAVLVALQDNVEQSCFVADALKSAHDAGFLRPVIENGYRGRRRCERLREGLRRCVWP